MARSRRLVTMLLFGALAACGKGEGGGQVQSVVSAWQKAGLEPTEFQPIDGKPLEDGTCRAGSVGGIDVTVCEYKDPETAKKAENTGLAKIGDTTGVARAEGKMLLVLADRKGHDPNGRTINRIVKTFSEVR